MGHQQMLLMSIGVLAAGLAIVVGVSLLSEHSFQANKSAVASDILNIASSAREYYNKPSNIGGGGHSFLGYKIPTSLVSTVNGTYSMVVTDQVITVTGTGTVADNSGKIFKSTTMVTPTSLTTSESNENNNNNEGDNHGDDNQGDHDKKDKGKDKEGEKDKG